MKPVTEVQSADPAVQRLDHGGAVPLFGTSTTLYHFLGLRTHVHFCNLRGIIETRAFHGIEECTPCTANKVGQDNVPEFLASYLGFKRFLQILQKRDFRPFTQGTVPVYLAKKSKNRGRGIQK